MPTPAYLSIQGTVQGNITAGASGEPSIGIGGRQGHEDEIVVQAFSHEIILPVDPQHGQPSGPRRHTPMILTKVFDKSSPLLYAALATGERLTCELKWFRMGVSGNEEHYFTMKMTDAVITNIKACMANCLDPANASLTHMEEVSINYKKVEWEHAVAGTLAEDDWTKPTS